MIFGFGFVFEMMNFYNVRERCREVEQNKRRLRCSVLPGEDDKIRDRTTNFSLLLFHLLIDPKNKPHTLSPREVARVQFLEKLRKNRDRTATQLFFLLCCCILWLNDRTIQDVLFFAEAR